MGAPRLALRLGRLGGEDISDADAARVLGAALDLGVRVFDAAPSYGHAERRLGDFARSVGRERVIVSTKGGYGSPGVPHWTAECIEKGVDLALARMGLDFIDVLHLHSCPREVLEGAGVIDALRRAQQAGKVGSVGYSGENEA